MSASINHMERIQLQVANAALAIKVQSKETLSRFYSQLKGVARIAGSILHNAYQSIKEMISTLTPTRVSVHLINTGLTLMTLSSIPAVCGNFIPLILGTSITCIGAGLNGLMQVIDPDYFYNLTH